MGVITVIIRGLGGWVTMGSASSSRRILQREGDEGCDWGAFRSIIGFPMKALRT